MSKDAAKYYFAHKELGLKGGADNLGVSRTELLLVFGQKKQKRMETFQPEDLVIMKVMKQKKMQGTKSIQEN